MRPLKSIGFLGLSPVLQSSACRISPLFSSQDSRSSCPALWVESRSFGRSQGSLSSFRWSSTSSTPSFTYRIGSSFSAKGRRLNTREDIHAFNITYSVSDNDIVTGRPGSGQDAFFVSRVGHSNNVAFGVADGVGGWSESGIDSAHFSHGLCRYMTAIARDAELSVGKRLGPRDLLQKGFDAVVKDTAIAGGGSTACVAVGEDDGHIEVAK